MNILMIGTTDILGGAARVSWELKKFLESGGHSVSMFVADKRSDDPKVKVIPRQLWRKYLGFLLATDDLLSSDWIMNTEEFKNADIVHCHNLHGRFFNLGTLEKMSLLKPVVWTLHDEWAITPHCAYTFEGREMRNGLYACRSIDTPPRLLWDNTKYLSRRKKQIYENSKLHVVTPSKWLFDRVKNTDLGKQDVKLIYNGIETEIFKQTNKLEARKALSLSEKVQIVLFLADDAKNNPWKGWGLNKEIISKYNDRKDVLFLCIGNHSNHPDEENIKYLKHIDDPNTLALYYSASDTLLFTSLAENFPLVILEAMSVGLPIVAFDVGGVKEALVHKENGYVANYGDIDDIERGLKWILNLSEEEIETIGKNSAKKIRDGFESGRMNNEYMNLYQEIVSHHENK